jgi:hypothetical protein
MKSFTLQREGGNRDFDGQKAFYFLSDSYTAGSTPSSKMHVYYVKEKDGVYMLGSEMDMSTDKFEMHSKGTMSPKRKFYPLPLRVGEKWSFSDDGKSHSSTLTSFGDKPTKTVRDTPSKSEGESEVTRQEDITVPAGTFHCFVVETNSNTDSDSNNAGTHTSTKSKTKSTSWIAPGVGAVKYSMEMDNETSFNSAAPTKSRMVSESVLKDYKINHKPAWGWEDAGEPKPEKAEAAQKKPATKSFIPVQ